MTVQVVPDEMMIVMAAWNDDVYNSVNFQAEVFPSMQ